MGGASRLVNDFDDGVFAMPIQGYTGIGRTDSQELPQETLECPNDLQHVGHARVDFNGVIAVQIKA